MPREVVGVVVEACGQSDRPKKVKVEVGVVPAAEVLAHKPWYQQAAAADCQACLTFSIPLMAMVGVVEEPTWLVSQGRCVDSRCEKGAKIIEG